MTIQQRFRPFVQQRPSAQPRDPFGRAFIIFFLLMLSEGVLRKWLLSPIQQPLIFVRDPVLIYIYYMYLHRARFNQLWLSTWIILMMILAAFGVLQIASGILPPAVILVGLRSYLLYVPLCFIMAECLKERAIKHLFRIALWLSLPIAVLVFVQFKLPPDSILNKGTSEGPKGVFLVAANVVRPYGPFTFVQAQNTYAVMMVALSIIAWERRRIYRLSPFLIGSATFASFTMGALSGGRTFFGGAILVAASYLLSSLAARSPALSVKRIATFAALVIGFVVVFTVVFPSSFTLMSERQQRATRNEGSTTARGVSMMTLAADSMQSAPMLGHGMAMGSPLGMAVAHQNGGAEEFPLGEYDWPRIVQELGPILGSVMIGLRIFMFALLGIAALRKNYLTGDNSALVLFGFSGYLVLTAQVVGLNPLLSFCWFSCGLTLALARLPQSPERHVSIKAVKTNMART